MAPHLRVCARTSVGERHSYRGGTQTRVGERGVRGVREERRRKEREREREREREGERDEAM